MPNRTNKESEEKSYVFQASKFLRKVGLPQGQYAAHDGNNDCNDHSGEEALNDKAGKKLVGNLDHDGRDQQTNYKRQ